MATEDDNGNLAAGEWSRCSRLSCQGVDTTLDTEWPGSGDDVGDLAAGEWRRCWRVSGWGVETTMVTVEWRRRWRLSDQAVETTLEAQRLGIGDDLGDLALKLLYFTLNSKK